MRRMAGWRPVSWLYARILSPIDPAVSRISGRRMTFVRLVSGLPVLLLTTTGARTGAKRTQPLLYLREGDALVVIGSNWDKRITRPGTRTSEPTRRQRSPSPDPHMRS